MPDDVATRVRHGITRPTRDTLPLLAKRRVQYGSSVASTQVAACIHCGPGALHRAVTSAHRAAWSAHAASCTSSSPNSARVLSNVAGM